MDKAEIFSYFVSLASIAVMVWQIVKNINLKKYIKSDAMELYAETGILLGNAQTCLKELQAGNNSIAIQEVGKAEGMAQVLFQHSIKNISHHFNLTNKKVDEWVNKKKIREYHKDAFLKYV